MADQVTEHADKQTAPVTDPDALIHSPAAMTDQVTEHANEQTAPVILANDPPTTLPAVPSKSVTLVAALKPKQLELLGILLVKVFEQEATEIVTGDVGQVPNPDQAQNDVKFGNQLRELESMLKLRYPAKDLETDKPIQVPEYDVSTAL